MGRHRGLACGRLGGLAIIIESPPAIAAIVGLAVYFGGASAFFPYFVPRPDAAFQRILGEDTYWFAKAEWRLDTVIRDLYPNRVLVVPEEALPFSTDGMRQVAGVRLERRAYDPNVREDMAGILDALPGITIDFTNARGEILPKEQVAARSVHCVPTRPDDTGELVLARLGDTYQIMPAALFAGLKRETK
jgi:hypothetical protein